VYGLDRVPSSGNAAATGRYRNSLMKFVFNTLPAEYQKCMPMQEQAGIEIPRRKYQHCRMKESGYPCLI
jgi:hypothetical protein